MSAPILVDDARQAERLIHLYVDGKYVASAAWCCLARRELLSWTCWERPHILEVIVTLTKKDGSGIRQNTKKHFCYRSLPVRRNDL